MSTVAYTIITNKNDIGGHFYSLLETAKMASNSLKRKIIIINLGRSYSPIIRNSEFESYFVNFNGINYFSAYINFYKIIKLNDVSIIHSFDVHSFVFARVYAYFNSIKIILTKAGGANPHTYFPKARDIIVYSKENFSYFKAKYRKKNINLYFLPNRISNIRIDNNRIEILSKKIDKNNSIVFLRICRIGEYYKKSIIQSCNLVKRLSDFGLNVKLVVIGKIQDEKIYYELKNKFNDNTDLIYFITQKVFTINANEIINLADCVIGTGRGLMEAAQFGKILITPTSKSDFPILVTEDNFCELFKTNFSERNELQDFSEEKNIALIKNLISENSLIESYKKFSINIYNKYFNIENVTQKYDRIYSNKNSIFPYDQLFDIFAHFLFVSWRFLKVRLK